MRITGLKGNQMNLSYDKHIDCLPESLGVAVPIHGGFRNLVQIS